MASEEKRKKRAGPRREGLRKGECSPANYVTNIANIPSSLSEENELVTSILSLDSVPNQIAV